MSTAALILAGCMAMAWAVVRRCPLLRAIGCQIDQVAEASR